jgi:hypothetical protein
VTPEVGFGQDETDRRRVSALASVANHAAARCGEFTGFDCILIFLTWDQLQELDPEFQNSLFLTLDERNARFAARYDSQLSRITLIRILLNLALNGTDDKSVSLASDIITRMSELYPHETARPLIYATGIDDGVAISLTVYDDLWRKGK